MGSSRRVMSRSEGAGSFGRRSDERAVHGGTARPGVQPGGWSTDRNPGARRGRAAGAGWILSGVRCARPALSNPVRFARLGATLRGRQRGDAPSGRFPQGPPARGCCVVQWWFAPLHGLAPAAARTDRGMAGRHAARSNWKMPNPILPSRSAPRASANCCTSHAGRIAAGAARAVFLQVQTAPAATDQAVPPALVCVLPRNASAEQCSKSICRALRCAPTNW